MPEPPPEPDAPPEPFSSSSLPQETTSNAKGSAIAADRRQSTRFTIVNGSNGRLDIPHLFTYRFQAYSLFEQSHPHECTICASDRIWNSVNPLRT